jgi:hypothetical protein
VRNWWRHGTGRFRRHPGRAAFSTKWSFMFHPSNGLSHLELADCSEPGGPRGLLNKVALHVPSLQRPQPPRVC